MHRIVRKDARRVGGGSKTRVPVTRNKRVARGAAWRGWWSWRGKGTLGSRGVERTLGDDLVGDEAGETQTKGREERRDDRQEGEEADERSTLNEREIDRRQQDGERDGRRSTQVEWEPQG